MKNILLYIYLGVLGICFIFIYLNMGGVMCSIFPDATIIKMVPVISKVLMLFSLALLTIMGVLLIMLHYFIPDYKPWIRWYAVVSMISIGVGNIIFVLTKMFGINNVLCYNFIGKVILDIFVLCIIVTVIAFMYVAKKFLILLADLCLII